jgi:copper chaperone CopZ
MRTFGLSAAFLGLLAIALGGCDKHQAQANRKTPAAATRAQSPLEPVKVMEETPRPAATAEGEGGECGSGMAKGESCEGGCNQWDTAAGEVARRVVPDDAEWKTIPVSGMTCGGCERRIIANLGKVQGVLAVEADAELGQVRIAMAKGADLRKVAVDHINALGYSAQ